MSDSGEQEHPWSFYAQDMLDFAERVLGYTSGLDIAGFVADQRTYDATLNLVTQPVVLLENVGRKAP